MLYNHRQVDWHLRMLLPPKYVFGLIASFIQSQADNMFFPQVVQFSSFIYNDISLLSCGAVLKEHNVGALCID